MATGPKIVHKQFNSPIGLYSQQNIKETLNKHLQNLDNGTVGIDFHNPVTDKPANLANSAVLRMLEEEERNRKGLPKLDPTQIQAILENLVYTKRRFESIWPPKKTKADRSWNGHINSTSYIHSELMKAAKGQKKVVWPPAPETNGYHQSQQQSPAYNNNAQHSPSQQQFSPQSQQQYSPQPQQQYSPQPHQQPQYQPQYQVPQAQSPHSYQQSYQPPQSQPAYCEGRRQEPTGLSKLIPVGPGVTASPVAPSYRQGPLSPSAQPYRQQQSRWAPVPAPTSPQPQYNQPQYSPQPQYSEPVYQPPQKPFEPPPTTITLRPQPPVHQQPPPVYSSQPATASYKGGVNMRGDQKWPPQSVKEAVAAENEARRQLAKGPACRPRKVKKDYTSFFQQHALNHSYTSYRVPPGTQHFDYHSGQSSY
ncbi:pollen-specific leucine-rich repeat extensin-like protein 1 isoform X1 [Melitaea cinxia]|uniref:pollen-specific leucine-rich repeat extensin-like protein 1 isoform X1 n=1 Tax=Melitaea cinxia TaxID=113334 RepID=UPI001E270351|nr:pollen-specific leucine-rich repeat extensin-like protein 1 isoform X1 [Melitaea cinxia]